MHYNNRPHPHVDTGPIAPGTIFHVDPSPTNAYAPYAFEVDPPAGYMSDPWDDGASAPNTAYASYYGNGDSLDLPPRPRSRTRSVFEPPTEYLAFPEPQIYRSSSQRVSPTPYHPLHRNSKSDSGPLAPPELTRSSLTRAASPYYPTDEVCVYIILDGIYSMSSPDQPK
jgi:RHO1 GDP-GTP exchange protein 1/2